MGTPFMEGVDLQWTRSSVGSECQTTNLKVAGSSPAGSAIFFHQKSLVLRCATDEKRRAVLVCQSTLGVGEALNGSLSCTVRRMHMPFYQWDPQFLGLQVPAMDEEHQILIKKMNAVYDLNQKQGSKVDLEKVLRDFTEYTLSHFRDEEAFMEKIQFESLKTHQIIHKQLLAQLNTHLDQFKHTGKLSSGFFDFLGVWLTSHIRSIDHKYAEVARKKAA